MHRRAGDLVRLTPFTSREVGHVRSPIIGPRAEAPARNPKAWLVAVAIWQVGSRL